MGSQSPAPSAMTAVVMVFIVTVLCIVAAVTVGDDDVPLPAGTTLCSPREYTSADGFASDIDQVLKFLVHMDSDTFPTIDVNIYSPGQQNAVAFGQRVCSKTLVPDCVSCFEEAQSRLVSGCRDYFKAGGQATLVDCFMRYEIYDFITTTVPGN